jgi:hypothetical protein
MAEPVKQTVVKQTVASNVVDRPRKVSGSVLGLPATASNEPMVFGERARSADEVEVGALTNYGKDPYAGGGHGGTIALVIAVIIVSGAVLAYFYIPSVHARVDAFVARVRNRGQEPQQAVAKPRAMIFPPRTSAVKNMVKVQGDVINSDPTAPLEAPIYVEVSLERRDGAPADKRNVPVAPEPLAPSQRGVYEFEYDGKMYSGVVVSKLYSNGEEVKYSAPQKR